jgi:hypothetical protein
MNIRPGWLQIMRLQNTVYDWNPAAADIIYRYIPRYVSFFFGVREEEQVASVKSWFHRATAPVQLRLNQARKGSRLTIVRRRLEIPCS